MGCVQYESGLARRGYLSAFDNCGFECNRDLNAAINLRKEAVRLTVLACGLDSADTS
ncbi:MAG: hypothetical protein ACSI46_24365 [Gloeotrichia echinulata DVL01]|nr:transposase [Gloeotrichia echinulata DEX184]